jgi:hypothetical protein
MWGKASCDSWLICWTAFTNSNRWNRKILKYAESAEYLKGLYCISKNLLMLYDMHLLTCGLIINDWFYKYSMTCMNITSVQKVVILNKKTLNHIRLPLKSLSIYHEKNTPWGIGLNLLEVTPTPRFDRVNANVCCLQIMVNFMQMNQF